MSDSERTIEYVVEVIRKMPYQFTLNETEKFTSLLNERLDEILKIHNNEDVLDKIREEIIKQAEEWKSYNSNSVAYKNIANGLYRAVNVIDKYRKGANDYE